MPGFKRLEAKGAERQIKMPAMSWGITRHEDSRTRSTGSPEDRLGKYTMKQRRGQHQGASGYWEGEEGSR